MNLRLALVAELLALQTGGCFAQLTLPQLYRDARTGLVIRYPAGWILDPNSVAFAIVDFSPARRPPQVLVPKDHAEIGIFALPSNQRTVEDWARSEHINETRGYQLSQSRIRTKHLGIIEATVARATPSVIPDGTQLIYRFEIRGRPVGASLIYRGPSRAAHFERILRSMIEDLQVASEQ